MLLVLLLPFWTPRRPAPASLRDEELVSQYKATGDPELIGELFVRYTDVVFLVCMKYLRDEAESQDAAMFVFEKLLRDLPRYEPKQFKFWLHTLTKNHCLALLNQRKKSAQKAEAFAQDTGLRVQTAPPDPLDDDWDLAGASLGHLPDALAALRPEQRQCVELFYIEGKSYAEIAEMTDFQLNAVKSHIQNGKRNLKLYLEKRLAGRHP